MDRDALILYLRNVRDLELAKVVMEEEYAENQADYQYVQSQLHLNPDYWAEKAKSGPGAGVAGAIVLFVFAVICFVFCAMTAGVRIIGGILTGFLVIAGILAVIIGFVLLARVFSVSADIDAENAKIKAHNAEEAERIPGDTAEYQRNEQAWKAYERDVAEEYQKLKDILDDFYSANIIHPIHRGKLANIQYLYETAAGTMLDYTAITLDAHIEDGIRRIEGKLNELISVAHSILNETHCMRMENNRAAQQQIEQNNAMLRQLESTAASTREAAEYSRLAANYAEANAWFSLANFLK